MSELGAILPRHLPEASLMLSGVPYTVSGDVSVRPGGLVVELTVVEEAPVGATHEMRLGLAGRGCVVADVNVTQPNGSGTPLVLEIVGPITLTH